MSRFKSVWTDDEDATLRRKFKMGRSWEEIAEALPGRSMTSIRHRASRLQLSNDVPTPVLAQGDGILGRDQSRAAAEDGSARLAAAILRLLAKRDPESHAA